VHLLARFCILEVKLYRMKRSILYLIAFAVLGGGPGLLAQSLDGAWEKSMTTEAGENLRMVAIMSDGYFATSTYDKEAGTFVLATGGTYQLQGGKFTRTFEFHTMSPKQVGQTHSLPIRIEGDKFYFNDDDPWVRIDSGNPGKLKGAWLISGRKRGEELTRIDTDRARKTMKILSGTRFQWIAYHTGTGEFFGTGGGTYTTGRGKYTENIEFFSRDNSRVGASLGFDYELRDGEWHHSGKSSKGDPIYEIWSLRE